MNEQVTSALRADGVSVRYGRRVALDGVTLDIPRGSVCALLGRNGAGKSSLVRCLAGLQKPQGGSVSMFGEDVWTHRARLLDRAALVGEDSDVPPRMRVSELAAFFGRIYSRWDRSAVDARLRRFHIAPEARFGELSKGQKKQVTLSLALASSPELLILDDPTLGLDAVARRSLFEEVVAELADRGITVLLTTHDLAGVESIADRVAILRAGRLVLDEELEVLKARFRRIRLTRQPVALETLAPTAVRRWGSDGAEAIVTNYDELAFERLRMAATIGAAEVAAMSLEEIFIEVAGEEA